MEENIMRLRGNNVEKAKKLSEIRLTCLNYPLDREDLTKFYVDTSEARGVDMLKRLTLSLEYVPSIYQHVLYLGHRGSGKSTVLYQLEQNLSETYNVIRFSVQDHLDINRIDFVDLLFIMYERIFLSCADSIGKSKENYKCLEDIYNKWYASTEWQIEEEETYSSEISAEAGFGLQTKLINLFSKLTSVFKFGGTETLTIRKNVKLSIKEYIDRLNELVRIASEGCGKPILLIFEDLEKISLNVAEKLFLEDSKHIPSINLHMVLTTPIYLKYSMQFRGIVSLNFTSVERCPMIAVTDAKKNKFEIGFNTMREIVYARVDKELIESIALDKAISYSGGVLRDLFGMLCEASLNCEISGRNIISVEDIERAFLTLQETCSDAIKDFHIPVIEEVYNNPQGPINSSEIFVELMCAEIVVEYNGEQWRGVHPAVSAYLLKHGLL